MKEVDDQDHYLCATGGVTGEPGGTVFFFLLVGYCGFLLFGSLFISFLVRHVPRPFMDKRLMSISVRYVLLIKSYLWQIFTFFGYFQRFLT